MIKIINDSHHPLVIVDGQQETHFGYFLAFGHEFSSHVYVKWGETTIDEIHNQYGQYSDIFLYQPSMSTVEKLTSGQNYYLENLVPGLLWRLNNEE